MTQNNDTFSCICQIIAQSCRAVTITIYALTAFLLIVAALISVNETITLAMQAMKTPTQQGLSNLLQAILLIIVIATLVDMIASYVRAGRVLIRPILIAGITTMVRRLLVNDLTFIDTIGTTIVILGLTVAMIYGGHNEIKIEEQLKEMKQPEEQ
ncbi:MAG TPA: phosphate-starvation-inducible PsiE family protein [Methanocorpusculum sp.]|nr:phosphate-starvation-inducible PsiE family protein [Methanocorpusculum sp.]